MKFAIPLAVLASGNLALAAPEPVKSPNHQVSFEIYIILFFPSRFPGLPLSTFSSIPFPACWSMTTQYNCIP